MRAVDVGIGHDDDLVVTQFRHVGLLGVFFGADCHAECLVYVDDLVAGKHLVVLCLLDVENLSAKRKNGLEVGIAALFRRTACRVSLDKKQLAFHSVAALAGREFAGQTGTREGRLVLHAHARRLGGVTRLCGQHDFVDYHLGLFRMLLKVVAQGLADCRLHHSHHFVIAELGLGLSLELGFGHLD